MHDSLSPVLPQWRTLLTRPSHIVCCSRRCLTGIGMALTLPPNMEPVHFPGCTPLYKTTFFWKGRICNSVFVGVQTFLRFIICWRMRSKDRQGLARAGTGPAGPHLPWEITEEPHGQTAVWVAPNVVFLVSLVEPSRGRLTSTAPKGGEQMGLVRESTLLFLKKSDSPDSPTRRIQIWKRCI